MICPFCNFEHTVAVPCVHTNGTSAEELLTQLDRAIDAMSKADNALLGSAPNARDHYLNGTDQKARKEHELRREKLLTIVAELVQMRDHVQAVIEFKAEQKRSRI
jgi:hypothetical protein